MFAGPSGGPRRFVSVAVSAGRSQSPALMVAFANVLTATVAASPAVAAIVQGGGPGTKTDVDPLMRRSTEVDPLVPATWRNMVTLMIWESSCA